MAKLSSKTSSSNHRVLIFGGPKAGKTLLAGKLAQYYKLLWVDMENGHETLFQLPVEWQDNIELITLPDTRSFPIAIETCLKIVKGPVNICDTHGKVSCMLCKKDNLPTVDVNLPAMGNDIVAVFDSLTQLSNSAIASITKGKPDDYKLDYDDWGNLGKLLDIFLSHLQQANYNVIVISHETEAETEGKKKKLVPVGGTRNFSRNIAKYFDHVVYAETKNRKHVFSSSSTGSSTILTGSRSGVSLEDDPEGGSLLQIFKPELYAGNAAVVSATQTTTSSATKPQALAAKASAASILERMKNK